MTGDDNRSQGATFHQPGWTVTVHGNFIQAAGDVNLSVDSSKENLIDALREFRENLAKLETLEAEQRSTAVSEVDAAIREAEQETPASNKIAQRLDSVKETLSSFAGAAEETTKAIKTVAQLAKWAIAIIA